MFKRESKINSLAILFSLIFILISIPQVSDAQVTREQLGVELLNDFVLEPAKNEVLLNPGESSVEYLSIINRKAVNVDFQIQIEDIVGSDDIAEQVKLLGDEKGPYSLKDFLIPEITEFTLEPGEKITIPVRVELSQDAEPRGYYGALIVSSRGDDSRVDSNGEVSGKTEIITRLGSIFLVRINGDVIEKSELVDFKTIGPKKYVYFSNPEGFEVAIKNKGNVHLVHYGEIKIKNLFGKEVTSLPINAFFSLPDSTRYRELSWKDGFAFGFYRAELALYQGFENEDGFLDSNIWFFVLPWKLTLGLLLLAFVIFVVIRYFKKNFKLERKK
ncbi:MAG: hypothetical protein WC087_02315 [Candidatus Paceibacterota bacterium]